MSEVIVRTTALRWVADEQPGWIEVGLVDADGQQHRIIDKVPVLTTVAITPATSFPTELWIAADAGGVDGDRVAVTFASGVETAEGLTGMSVSAADVVWL